MQPRQPAKGAFGGGVPQSPSVPPFQANPGPVPGRAGSPPPLQPVGAPMQMSNQYVRTPIVKYSRRMRVGKIHPVKVTLASHSAPSLGFQSSNASFDPPVVIQVTVPGAIVTPPHVIVPLAGGEASFYVQPLMAGRLVGGRVEFLSQGRKIGEVNLPMKANRGRLAKWLFLFAILVPFIINFFPDLSFTDRVRPTVPPPEEKKKPFPASQPDEHVAANTEWMLTSLRTQPPGKEPGKETPAKEKPQAPEKQNGQKDTKSDANTKPQKPAPRKPESDPGAVDPDDQPPRLVPHRPGNAELTIPYKGEDAIWAWVRSKLHEYGYQTKQTSLASTEAHNPIVDLVTINRHYEITSEGSQEWNTGKAMSLGLYYAEPVLRFLYRLFIVFPRTLPFGDLIYGLVFLSLAALVWLARNPNRRTIKGPVMNIHVGS
jgi:hypothetical protein